MGQYFNSISNHENNQYYLPEDGSSVMDIRLRATVNLTIQNQELTEHLGGSGEGEEAVNPASYLADRQEEISESLANSLSAQLEKINNSGGRMSGWANQPPEPVLEGEDWKTEIMLRAHVQGPAIKQSLMGRIGGKISEEIAEDSRAEQEEQAEQYAQEVKAALEAALSENQDVYSPLSLLGLAEMEIEYTAEMRLDRELDAHLGSETQTLSL